MTEAPQTPSETAAPASPPVAPDAARFAAKADPTMQKLKEGLYPKTLEALAS